MNNYTIRYTIWDPKKPKPNHKQFTFQSENDLLAGADEGMCQIYDANPDKELLFRSIELNNAKEAYEEMVHETPTTV